MVEGSDFKASWTASGQQFTFILGITLSGQAQKKRKLILK